MNKSKIKGDFDRTKRQNSKVEFQTYVDHDNMKLVFWNCNQAFRNKYENILELDPDVLVISECEYPADKGDWTQFSDWTWTGEDKNKGLGIFTRKNTVIDTVINKQNKCKYALPVKLDNELKILGIWAKNNRQNPKKRYIAQVYNAIKKYSDWIDNYTIVGGDFNWNANFTKSKPLQGDFKETLSLLNKHKLHSAYHTLTNNSFGNESDPTFYMHKNENKPYHIDYVFLPHQIIHSINNFSIGTYDKWTQSSDHMPLILEIE